MSESTAGWRYANRLEARSPWPELTHLVDLIDDLQKRGIGLKVLTGQGANIDTTTASGKLVFGIFAALAEFERELISERTTADWLLPALAAGAEGAVTQ